MTHVDLIEKLLNYNSKSNCSVQPCALFNQNSFSLPPTWHVTIALSFLDSAGEDWRCQLSEPGMPECWSVAPSTLQWSVMLCVNTMCLESGQTQMLFSLSHALSADECIWKVILTPSWPGICLVLLAMWQFLNNWKSHGRTNWHAVLPYVPNFPWLYIISSPEICEIECVMLYIVNSKGSPCWWIPVAFLSVFILYIHDAVRLCCGKEGEFTALAP